MPKTAFVREPFMKGRLDNGSQMRVIKKKHAKQQYADSE